MKYVCRTFSIYLIILWFPVILTAQTDDVRKGDYMIRANSYGLGYASIFDTYLSPQEYKGMDFRFTRETMRMAHFNEDNVSIQNLFQTTVGYTHNRADNNNTFSGLINWNHGMHYQFRITDKFKILTGGLGDFTGGFVYNLRNTNNPASARAYINLAVSGMVIWHTQVKNLPVTLRYQANVPVAGIMFSPHYGQSYYEIFTLGNTRGVLKFVSLHNQPSIRQFFTLDFPVGETKFRFSYVWDVQQSNVNEIRTHTYGHVFLVGVVKEMLRIRRNTAHSIPSSILVY